MLDTLPEDVLDHIGFYAATHSVLGPPSGILPLLSVSRSTYSALSLKKNPYLYARIFKYKFDCSAPHRRLAKLHQRNSGTPHNFHEFTHQIYADELVKRCLVLQRLRLDEYARVQKTVKGGEIIDELLWMAYLMVLENEGKNVVQLKYYARIGDWLSAFWFDPAGASEAQQYLSRDTWPLSSPAMYCSEDRTKMRASLAMWLFWFFLEPASYIANKDLLRRTVKLLKLISLNAPLYSISYLPWFSFTPEPEQIHLGPFDRPYDPSGTPNKTSSFSQFSVTHNHFSYPIRLTPPPPPAIPASIAFLALVARAGGLDDTAAPGDSIRHELGPFNRDGGIENTPLPFVAFPRLSLNIWGRHSSDPAFKKGVKRVFDVPIPRKETFIKPYPVIEDSRQWDCEWSRCTQVLVAEENPEENMNKGNMTNPERPISWKPPYDTYKIGSVSDFWEGRFAYTDFAGYAKILSGARPSGIDDHSIAQLAQTWRINEYHLLSPLPTEDRPQNVPMSLESAPIPEGSTSGRDPKNVFTPLPNGDANLAHLPEGITITEWEEKSKEGLDVFLPGETKIVRRYVRYPGFLATTPTTSRDQIKTHVTNDTSNKDTGDKREQVRNNWSEEDRTKDEDEYKTRVLDILLAGDGHSGWGEFKIYGRVRPSDGLITILKEYTAGDRGRWLYRGYLVGGGTSPGEGEACGYLVGRWRDTLSPPETHGYEGIFAMARRR